MKFPVLLARGQRLSAAPEVYAYDPARIWANDKSGCISGEACSSWLLVYKDGTCLANVLNDAGNGYRFTNFGLADSDDFLYAPDAGGIQDNTYAKSGYTPYSCPHPLTGLTGSCDPNIAGRTGYNVGQDTTPPAVPAGLIVN